MDEKLFEQMAKSEAFNKLLKTIVTKERELIFSDQCTEEQRIKQLEVLLIDFLKNAGAGATNE